VQSYKIIAESRAKIMDFAPLEFLARYSLHSLIAEPFFGVRAYCCSCVLHHQKQKPLAV